MGGPENKGISEAGGVNMGMSPEAFQENEKMFEEFKANGITRSQGYMDKKLATVQVMEANGGNAQEEKKQFISYMKYDQFMNMSERESAAFIGMTEAELAEWKSEELKKRDEEEQASLDKINDTADFEL